MLVDYVETNSPLRSGHKWQDFRREKHNEKTLKWIFIPICPYRVASSESCLCEMEKFSRSETDFVSPKQAALRRRHFSCTMHPRSCNRCSSRKLVIHLVALSECASAHMIYCNHSIQWHFSKSSQCDFDMSTSWDNSSSTKSPLFTIHRSPMHHYDARRQFRPMLARRRRRPCERKVIYYMNIVYDAGNIIIIFHRVYENWISIFFQRQVENCVQWCLSYHAKHICWCNMYSIHRWVLFIYLHCVCMICA